MSITLFPNQFPPQTAPFVDKDGKLNNNTGNPFLTALWQRTGAGTGIVNEVGVSLNSINPISALALVSDWNEVISDTGGGVELPSLTGGQLVVVKNSAGVNLRVNAPTGTTIDGAASYTLPGSKMQIFFFFSSSVIYSCQLG